MKHILEAVFRPGTELARHRIGLRPYVRLDPSPAHVLKSQHQLINVGVPLALQGATVRHTVLDVDDEATRGLGRVVHSPRERQEPFDVTVGMNAAVGSRIRIWWTGKKEVYAFPRDSRK